MDPGKMQQHGARVVPAMARDVFISYAERDRPTAELLCAELERDGLSCWIAPRDVPPGKPWASSIVEAVDACRAMVVVFSAASNASVHVPREVQRADTRGIAVIPVRIEAVEPAGALAYFLAGAQWIDAVGGLADDRLQAIKVSLAATLGRAPAAPRPPRVSSSLIKRRTVVAASVTLAVGAATGLWTLMPRKPRPVINSFDAFEWRSQRTKQVVYVGADGGIYELYQRGRESWASANLLELIGGGVPPPDPQQPSIVGFAWEGLEMKQVSYRDRQQHQRELWVRTGSAWEAADLTAISSRPGFLQNATLGAAFTSEGRKSKSYLYVSRDGQLQVQAVSDTGTWTDATVRANGATPRAAITLDDNRSLKVAVTAFGWRESDHVMFVGIDDHLHAFESNQPDVWEHADLTAVAKAPAAARSRIVGFGGANAETKHVVYTAVDGHLHELQVSQQDAWRDSDLMMSTPDAAPLPLPLPDSLDAYPSEAGSRYVVYVASDRHVHVLAGTTDGVWQHVDATASADSPSVISEPSAHRAAVAAFFSSFDRTHYIVYVGDDHHVNALFLPQLVARWQHDDLTRATGGVPVWSD